VSCGLGWRDIFDKRISGATVSVSWMAVTVSHEQTSKSFYKSNTLTYVAAGNVS
jgi:hypothetical protein